MMPRQGQNIFAPPPKGILKLFQKLKNIKISTYKREGQKSGIFLERHKETY
jgi:hypothetical protein